jgi:hypothetical protein
MHVEAIWLRRIGNKVEVLFESLGKWHLAITESADGAFSYIAEHPALESAPLDDVVSNARDTGV